MCLSDIREFEYSINDPTQDDFIVCHVKLTDSALKILETSSRNPNASFKLSLNGDHGSLVVQQPNRSSHYTFSSQPLASNDAFQDCVSFKKNRVISYGKYASRLIINAKEDSFEMARERMVQAENDQRNSCSKQLNGTRSSNSSKKPKAPQLPRNCSQDLNERKVKPIKTISNDLNRANECISSKNIREIAISLLALRAHNLVELHQKLKCRNDHSLKTELNKILKEIAVCGSDGSFKLLPRFYDEVDPSWSGYTSIDRIKVEHIKKKLMASSSSRQKPTSDMPISLSEKIAILDELRAGELTYSQLLRKHSIPRALLDQWQANEDELRDSFKCHKNGSINTRNASPERNNVAAQSNTSSMRISTAPRLPSAASTKANRSSNGSHHFLGDIGLATSLRPGSGSNSAPVSADGSQTTLPRRNDGVSGIVLAKEYPIVSSTHSQKSSSGCSSMSSSILSSPQTHQGLSAYVSAAPLPSCQEFAPKMTKAQIASSIAPPPPHQKSKTSCKNSDLTNASSASTDPFAPLSINPRSVELDSQNTKCHSKRRQGDDEYHADTRLNDSYHKKVPRINMDMPVTDSVDSSQEDHVAIATRIARSMRGSKDTSEGIIYRQEDRISPGTEEIWKDTAQDRPEPNSCNSGPFMTPDQVTNEMPAEFHCANKSISNTIPRDSEHPMAFSVSEEEKLRLKELFPAIHTMEEVHKYKQEFDDSYPSYLSLREKSNQRWFELKRLYDELQEASVCKNASRTSLATQLSALVSEVSSDVVQDEESRLATLDAKLRLLKSRIYHFNDRSSRKRHKPHDPEAYTKQYRKSHGMESDRVKRRKYTPEDERRSTRIAS